jgi:micrococcal nuclease
VRPLIDRFAVPCRVALVVLSCTACSDAFDLPDGANAIVERVADGDTIDARFVVEGHAVDERVRFIGVDTPETKKPGSPIECFGPEASARTAELLPPGTPIMVHRDTEPRDDYGRLLGYVYRASDGLFVNELLLAEGFASKLAIGPNDRLATRFAAVEADAREAGLGMWASCFTDPTGSVTS